jgi:L,D-transpeptidase catalytic domain
MTVDPTRDRLRALYSQVTALSPEPPPFGIHGAIQTTVRRRPRVRAAIVGVAAASILVGTGVATQMTRPRNQVSESPTTSSLSPNPQNLVCTEQVVGASKETKKKPEPKPGASTAPDDLMAPFIMKGDSLAIAFTTASTANIGDLVMSGYLPRCVIIQRIGNIVSMTVTPRIRRLVGLGGDRVQLREGTLYRNGAALIAPLGDAKRPSASSAEYVVPPGQFAALPDDRTVVEEDWWHTTLANSSPVILTDRRTVMAEVIDAKRPLEVFSSPYNAEKRKDVRALGTTTPPLGRYIVSQQDGKYLEIEIPQRPDPDERGWHPPIRGWVDASNFRITTVRERIDIDLAKRTLTATFPDGHQITALVAVGKGDTPTPRGRYQTLELKKPPADSRGYGAGIYRTTAQSDVLRTYGPENPYRIAIQGTYDTESLGKAVSAGNVRTANDVWVNLKDLPLGTPIVIQ